MSESVPVELVKAAKPAKPAEPKERVYGAGYKLIGKNYQTSDMLAKVTAKQNMPRTFAPKACCFAGWC